MAVAALPAACSFDFSEEVPSGDGGPPPGNTCPQTEPPEGTACEAENLDCEFGDDPREGCRTVTKCTGGAWVAFRPSCTCTATDDPMCPDDATGPAVNCEAFGERSTVCVFAGGSHCGCAPEERIWTCPEPPAGCPVSAPDYGAPCPGEYEDASCVYGDCLVGTRIVRKCSDGRWLEQPTGCTNFPACGET